MKRAISVVVGLAALAGLTWGVVRLTADDAAGNDEQLIVIDSVGRATLQDTVIVRGSIVRHPLFTVTALSPQRVIAVGVEVDQLVEEGTVLFRLDGRPMLAVSGTTPFWRPLARFVDDGPDVEMLEQFLADAGYSPGTIDQQFSGATRDALEEWQRANGYPDDGQFLPTDVVVQSWPATVGNVAVEIGDSVAPGQPLVSFVESELAVSIRVDPTDRSRLEVGLPGSITVTASEVEASGTITELADAPEVDGQGVERYAGEMTIDGELDLVEGAAVRVEVVLTQVVDALVVPVAAVSLDGNGNEEVRILAADGTIERVAVVTGLTEGALVEIVEGLDGSEQVVVEVRQ